MATTSAVHAAAAWSTLALAIVLTCWNFSNNVVVALLGVNDLDTIAVSLLRALGLVSTVTVSAGVRHDEG